MIDDLYDYAEGQVFFKPTLAFGPRTFRPTKEGALAYFVGGNPNFPEDTGFALKGWTAARYDNNAAENGIHGPRIVPAQRPNRPARATFLGVVAELWVLGVAVDLAAANHGRAGAPADLPLYPFQRRRFWLERRAAGGAAGAAAHHRLA